MALSSCRKKLEPQSVKAPSSRVDANEQHDRDIQVPAIDTTPVNQVEVPPWAESYEISSNEMDGWCKIFRFNSLFNGVQINSLPKRSPMTSIVGFDMSWNLET
jgi:hypothetical protein